MPTWDSILEERKKLNPGVLLDKYLEEIAKLTKRSTIVYFSCFTLSKPYSPNISINDGDMQGFMTCANGIDKENVDIILHTPGGDYEATKRIINYLHSVFKNIRVIVPHMAMSGGTLIACASDKILMGPYSSLGPTDPQVFINGKYIPAEAAISEFKRAFKEVNENPRSAILWNERLKTVPFGQIVSIETMVMNSYDYLKEMLNKKNCAGKSSEEIEKIANFFSSHFQHSSHSRGLSLNEVKKIGLNVENLSDNKDLEDKVLSIYHIITIIMQETPAVKIIANHQGKKFVVNG